ncbi:MAG: hypothetical protein PHG06_00230 [Parabacteroides sp.]|nr:hypothetical protein [Parabacteroides sp.]
MKLEIAAKNAKQAIDYLRKDLQIKGRILVGRVDIQKNWHGDLLDITADRGELRNIYRVQVEAGNEIQNNVQYVL